MLVVIFIILLSIIFYYFGLVYLTKEKFRQSGMLISNIVAMIIPLYIFKVHLNITKESGMGRKKKMFVMKKFFLEYDLPLVILVETILFEISEHSENVVRTSKKTSPIRDFFKSLKQKKEYKDSLVDFCV